MSGYAIWTFDLVTTYRTDKKTGKVVRHDEPAPVLWQDCPPDWGYPMAIDRARHLEATWRSVFVVRRRGDDGEWSVIPPEDWARGRQMVLAKQSEKNAVAHRKGVARKIAHSPYKGGDA